jgi:hypothetical protein
MVRHFVPVMQEATEETLMMLPSFDTMSTTLRPQKLTAQNGETLNSEMIRTKILSPDCSDFDEVLRRNLLVVDKTLFIKEFMHLGCFVNGILRPKGFGKTFNLTMLKSFFSLGAKAEDFERFKIGKDKDFVKQHCGRYSVVHLDFKNCKKDSWEEMLSSIWRETVREIRLHARKAPDICSHYSLEWYDLESPHPPEFGTTRLLKDFTNALWEKYHNDVIVLIDEYDTPMSHAAEKGFFEEASNFFDIFFSAGLKGNSALSRACLFGTIPIYTYGPLGGFDILEFYTVTDKKFSSQFGFTEEEITEFVDNDQDKVKTFVEWCGGYEYGSKLLMRPKSFMTSFMLNEFVPTSSVGMLAKAFEKGSPLRRHLVDILPLLEKGTDLKCASSCHNFMSSRKTWDNESTLNFLTTHGYVTIHRRDLPRTASDQDDYYRATHENMARIPNREMRQIWIQELSKIVKKDVVLERLVEKVVWP